MIGFDSREDVEGLGWRLSVRGICSVLVISQFPAFQSDVSFCMRECHLVDLESGFNSRNWRRAEFSFIGSDESNLYGHSLI